MNFRTSVFIIMVFLALAGLHLLVNVQNVSLKYRLTDTKVKLTEINSRQRQLENQLAKEENLAAIENTARTKLGMVYPEKIIYLTASKETI